MLRDQVLGFVKLIKRRMLYFCCFKVLSNNFCFEICSNDSVKKQFILLNIFLSYMYSKFPQSENHILNYLILSIVMLSSIICKSNIEMKVLG